MTALLKRSRVGQLGIFIEAFKLLNVPWVPADIQFEVIFNQLQYNLVTNDTYLSECTNIVVSVLLTPQMTRAMIQKFRVIPVHDHLCLFNLLKKVNSDNPH